MQVAQQDRGIDQLSSLDQGQDVAFRAVGRKSCTFNHPTPLNALLFFQPTFLMQAHFATDD
jgi:hypothetical protein